MTNVLLEGKVAQILNERELVINIGAKDGVKKGTKFAVLAATATTIVDPDTKEELGIVDRPKVRVEAREVNDRFSICRTYETTVVGGGGLMGPGSISDILGSPRREVPKTLRAAEGSFPEPLTESESYVKIGDRVKQIPE